MATLGERIKESREANGLLQSQLAQLIGVKSAGVISNWEQDVSKPDANKIVLLCKALHISASYLLDYYGEKNPSDNEGFVVMDTLTPHEKELLTAYRNADEDARHIIDLVLKLYGFHPHSDKNAP